MGDKALVRYTMVYGLAALDELPAKLMSPYCTQRFSSLLEAKFVSMTTPKAPIFPSQYLANTRASKVAQIWIIMYRLVSVDGLVYWLPILLLRLRDLICSHHFHFLYFSVPP